MAEIIVRCKVEIDLVVGKHIPEGLSSKEMIKLGAEAFHILIKSQKDLEDYIQCRIVQESNS